MPPLASVTRSTVGLEPAARVRPLEALMGRRPPPGARRIEALGTRDDGNPVSAEPVLRAKALLENGVESAPDRGLPLPLSRPGNAVLPSGRTREDWPLASERPGPSVAAMYCAGGDG